MDRFVFDHRKLRGKIREVCGTEEKLASEIGISKESLSKKLNSKSYFTQGEIFSIGKFLNISENEVNNYFFNVLV